MPSRPVVTIIVTNVGSPLRLCRANKWGWGEAWGVESRLVWCAGERNGVRNWGQFLVCVGDHTDGGN